MFPWATATSGGSGTSNHSSPVSESSSPSPGLSGSPCPSSLHCWPRRVLLWGGRCGLTPSLDHLGTPSQGGGLHTHVLGEGKEVLGTQGGALQPEEEVVAQGCPLPAGTEHLLPNTAQLRVGTTQLNLGWRHEASAWSPGGPREGRGPCRTLDVGDVPVLALPRLPWLGIPLALEALGLPAQVSHDAVRDAEQVVPHLGWGRCECPTAPAQLSPKQVP